MSGSAASGSAKPRWTRTLAAASGSAAIAAWPRPFSSEPLACTMMRLAASSRSAIRTIVVSKPTEAAMKRMIEARSGEPWFAEALQAIEEEQAGEFGSVEDLIANLRRQIPLYFHRWEGNEQVGGRLAMDFAHAEPLHHFNSVEFPTFDLRPELRKVEAPTLVVAGDDDFICGPACADAIVGALRDARLVTIADSGHFVYVEQPEAFRAALSDFLL